MRKKFFFSYSRQNADVAKLLVKKLPFDESHLWIDYECLNLKECLVSQIKDALSRCDMVYALSTEQALSSSWVKFEIEYARLLEKPIVHLPVS